MLIVRFLHILPLKPESWDDSKVNLAAFFFSYLLFLFSGEGKFVPPDTTESFTAADAINSPGFEDSPVNMILTRQVSKFTMEPVPVPYQTEIYHIVLLDLFNICTSCFWTALLLIFCGGSAFCSCWVRVRIGY